MSNTFNIPPMAEPNNIGSLESISKRRAELLATREKITAQLEFIELEKDSKTQSLVNELMPVINKDFIAQLKPGEKLRDNILKVLAPAIIENVNQLVKNRRQAKKVEAKKQQKTAATEQTDVKQTAEPTKVMDLNSLTNEEKRIYLVCMKGFELLRPRINRLLHNMDNMVGFATEEPWTGPITETCVTPYITPKHWLNGTECVYPTIFNQTKSVLEEINGICDNITVDKLKPVQDLMHEFAVSFESCITTRLLSNIDLTIKILENHKTKVLNLASQEISLRAINLYRKYLCPVKKDANYTLYLDLRREYSSTNALIANIWGVNGHSNRSLPDPCALHEAACKKIHMVFAHRVNQQETKLPTWDTLNKRV